MPLLLCTVGPSATSLVSTHNRLLVCPFSPAQKGYNNGHCHCSLCGTCQKLPWGSQLLFKNLCAGGAGGGVGGGGMGWGGVDRALSSSSDRQTGRSNCPSLSSPPRDPCVPCVSWWLSTCVQGVRVRAHRNSFICSSHPGHYGYSSK